MKYQIDDLVSRLKDKKYEYPSLSGSGSHESTVLSNFNKNEEIALRQVVQEWILDHYEKNHIDVESMKTKISIYEEIVKKSNFQTMVSPQTKESD
jgi:carbamate kinase